MFDFIKQDKAKQYIGDLFKKFDLDRSQTLNTKLNFVDQPLVDLINDMLQFNPNNRISIEQSLANPIFDSIR